jgi:hypothetical protein
MRIRAFQLPDIQDIIAILTLNDQYGMPAVDGSDAMQRLHACPAAVFLVFECDGEVVGLVRGTGSKLVQAISQRFHERGAPTVSATVTERSLPFWESVGFTKTKAFVVGNW